VNTALTQWAQLMPLMVAVVVTIRQ
jgi:hypothetical protein